MILINAYGLSLSITRNDLTITLYAESSLELVDMTESYRKKIDTEPDRVIPELLTQTA